MKVRTIDIDAKEWFDRINGNSYFSAVVTVNFGMKNAKSYSLPFQYGYGEQYIQAAKEELGKQGLINLSDWEKHMLLWQYCNDSNIILRTHKQENCLKRELS